uniref:Neurotransmitter-gated ion-channel ligand-binding domain-containing protein n=1 Tax=Plectus sambesii TaxID=2011161 RepID=A0A914V0Z2_9BILA
MTITSEADIVRQLRVDYEASARPVKNPADPVMVAFEFEYLYLLGVNTAEESITLRFDYNMKWIDEYLQWTPSNVSAPVLTLNLLQEDVWQPDFVLEEMIFEVGPGPGPVQGSVGSVPVLVRSKAQRGRSGPGPVQSSVRSVPVPVRYSTKYRGPTPNTAVQH